MYAEAEPLLLKVFEGMKQREKTIPEAAARLVQRYEAWDKPDEAAKWRKEFEARQPGKEKQR